MGIWTMLGLRMDSLFGMRRGQFEADEVQLESRQEERESDGIYLHRWQAG